MSTPRQNPGYQTPASPPADQEPPPLPSRGAASFRLPPGVSERLTLVHRLADNGTWLFAAGLFFVVIFSIFPQMDAAKVARREALIIMGNVREKRLAEEFAKKEKPTDDEKDRRAKAKERWVNEKSDLEEDAEDAELARRRWPYWYRFGMLLGYALLAVGSLCYIRPSEPPVRRILGCIVLATLAVSFIGAGVRIELHRAPQQPQTGVVWFGSERRVA